MMKRAFCHFRVILVLIIVNGRTTLYQIGGRFSENLEPDSVAKIG